MGCTSCRAATAAPEEQFSTGQNLPGPVGDFEEKDTRHTLSLDVRKAGGDQQEASCSYWLYNVDKQP